MKKDGFPIIFPPNIEIYTILLPRLRPVIMYNALIQDLIHLFFGVIWLMLVRQNFRNRADYTIPWRKIFHFAAANQI